MSQLMEQAFQKARQLPEGDQRPSPRSSSRRSSLSGGGRSCSHGPSRPMFFRAWRMRLWPSSERVWQVSST